MTPDVRNVRAEKRQNRGLQRGFCLPGPFKKDFATASRVINEVVLEEVIGEVRRIPLPRNPVNNLFGECAGLGSLASSLLAGKGYGKDVL
jgi:hypothetical protein